jgi:hypothetical protein
VLTTCQPSTVWCSPKRLPAAAAQPAKVRQSCSATDYYFEIVCFKNKGLKALKVNTDSVLFTFYLKQRSCLKTQIHYLNFKTKFHSRATGNPWSGLTRPAGPMLFRPDLRNSEKKSQNILRHKILSGVFGRICCPLNRP